MHKVFGLFKCALCGKSLTIFDTPAEHRKLRKKLNFCAHHTANQVYACTRELKGEMKYGK